MSKRARVVVFVNAPLHVLMAIYMVFNGELCILDYMVN